MNRMYTEGACGCRAERSAPSCGQTYCRGPTDGRAAVCQPNLGTSHELSLAMAYVPPQSWEALYELEEGWKRGTIFQKLDMPWTVAGGGCR